MDPIRARLQLYVDDPALSLVGTRAWGLTEASVPLLWWLVLGLSLAWKKGYFGNGSHPWIGVQYAIGPSGPTMELPAEYLRETLEVLKPLCATYGTIPTKTVQKTLGKAARISYVIPDAAPYIASLWAAYAAGRRCAEQQKPGSSKHFLPIRRFAVAAQWCCTMLTEALQSRDFGAAALKRTMGNNRRRLSSTDLPTLSFDASPWGGGGILWVRGVPTAYTHFTWADHSLDIVRAARGSCKGQTAFEYLTLFMVAETFSSILTESGALIRGDNLGALSDALKLASTAPAMNAIAREMAWRRIVRQWQYSLTHLPSEQNDEADALSRLEAEPRRNMPQLGAARFVAPPAQNDDLWKARLDLSY